ncbi:hypothetical protein E2C01_098821 [Portunus trituberculatus]|uniref:Uncharacterized protein n=1 Tax=Portunus trituberculatus TaxID=210409 RepID=A0A5B7K8P5_PORTR|nr:hypothetical protein [Portunus trituberculatus]
MQFPPACDLLLLDNSLLAPQVPPPGSDSRSSHAACTKRPRGALGMETKDSYDTLDWRQSKTASTTNFFPLGADVNKPQLPDASATVVR